MKEKLLELIEQARLGDFFQEAAKCQFSNISMLNGMKNEFMANEHNHAIYGRLSTFVRSNFQRVKEQNVVEPYSYSEIPKESGEYDYVAEYKKLIECYNKFLLPEKESLESNEKHFSRLKDAYQKLIELTKLVTLFYKRLNSDCSFNTMEHLTYQTNDELTKSIERYKKEHNVLRNKIQEYLSNSELLEFLETLVETPKSNDTIKVLKDFVKELTINDNSCFNSWKNLRNHKDSLLDLVADKEIKSKFNDYFEKIDQIYLETSVKSFGKEILFIKRVNEVADYLKFLNMFSKQF